MSKLFRNSSPGALTLQQSIELEKKRMAEGKNQRGDARSVDDEPRVPKGNGRESGEWTREGANGVSSSADEPMEEIVVPGTLLTDDPRTNKKIEGLHPAIRYEVAKFINDVKDRTGKQLRIPPKDGGMRTIAEQDDLFAKGKTHAASGKSYHNYGLAFDVAILNSNGTINQDITPDIVAIAKEHGFEWGGDWASPKTDKPHFQRTYGYTTTQLRRMVAPDSGYPAVPGQRNR